jgi:hypothetical protein
VSDILRESGQPAVVRHYEPTNANPVPAQWSPHPNHIVPLKEDPFPLFSPFRHVEYRPETSVIQGPRGTTARPSSPFVPKRPDGGRVKVESSFK